MKGTAFIVLALFIDGVQAALSAAVLVMSAFPGTILGAAAGCLAGQSVAGGVGCQFGRFIFGLLGSSPFVIGLLDVATVPIGAILGFVVSICISATLGLFLIALLGFNAMFYPKYILTGGIVELLPGFSILPSWTAMTVACVLQKNKDDQLAAFKIAAGLEGVMQADLGPNSYIQRGGNAVTPRGRAPAVDGIRAAEAQTNAA